jgi:dihydrofolate reductase
MNLIVAVDENWGIGYQGDLLIKISADLKYFKEKTIYQNVVMGMVTFMSLPNSKPLKNRTNIILSDVPDFQVEGAIVFHDMKQVLDFAKNSDKQTFIIGGAMVYELFIPYIKKAYITKIYHKFTADKYIPDFITGSDFKLSTESEMFETEDGIGYQFCVYEKNAK